MGEHRSSPILLLISLSAAVFLERTVWLMLGPLLGKGSCQDQAHSDINLGPSP
jgi:hypothetical protein